MRLALRTGFRLHRLWVRLLFIQDFNKTQYATQCTHINKDILYVSPLWSSVWLYMSWDHRGRVYYAPATFALVYVCNSVDAK